MRGLVLFKSGPEVTALLHELADIGERGFLKYVDKAGSFAAAVGDRVPELWPGSSTRAARR